MLTDSKEKMAKIDGFLDYLTEKYERRNIIDDIDDFEFYDEYISNFIVKVIKRRFGYEIVLNIGEEIRIREVEYNFILYDDINEEYWLIDERYSYLLKLIIDCWRWENR